VASQGLSHVTAVSAATNDTVYLNNTTTGLVVGSNVEVGGNLAVEGDLEFNGNLTMNTITVQTLFTLDHVVSQGNTTSNTVQFTNPTTALTATGNVEVGGELSVSGNVEVGEELSVSGNVEVGTANLFVDTLTGNVGMGTTEPTETLDIVGNLNLQKVSNTASIKLNSNVVTEYTRSKKLIKYPRVAMTANSSGGYVASASSEYNSSFEPWIAFNNVKSANSWISLGYSYNTDGTASGASAVDTFQGIAGSWIGIELPNKIKLEYVIIKNRDSSTIRNAENGLIWASNDGTTWVKIGGFYGLNTGSRAENEIQVNETNAYNEYRLQITEMIGYSGGGGAAVSISEVELYGTPEYDPEADGTDVIARSVPNVPNTDWLEVYYDAKNLADGSITTVDDLTPSGTNDGTATDVNVSDGAFVFNGTSSRISGSITQDAGAYAHTASVWCYINDEISELTENKTVFQIGDGGTNTSPKIELHTLNRIYVSFVGNYVYATEASRYIQSKNWTHVSYTYDGGPLTLNNPALYINGTRIGFFTSAGSQVGSALSLGSNPQLRVGCSAVDSGVLNGKIANFRLFNRALTGDEVWQLYAHQKEYFNVSPDVVTFKGGRLGIGTSEPRAVLDVRGDILGGCPVLFSANRYGGISGAQTIKFGEVHYNKGGGYSGKTGIFTAPLSGYYKFSYHDLTQNSTATTSIYAQINGGRTTLPNSTNASYYGVYDSSLDAVYRNLSGNWIVYLSAGETFELELTGGTLNSNFNCFTGFYLSS